MKLLSCVLLLALIAAASATFGKRWELSKGGNCGLICGLSKLIYKPVSRSSGKCLGVFGFLGAAIDDKLSHVSNIFKSHSNIVISKNIDVSSGTCLNLCKGVGGVLNKWVDGLGSIFEKLSIALTKMSFCVVDKPWSNGKYIGKWSTYQGAPAVCGKDFGSKWGWNSYDCSYSNNEDIIKYYELKDLDAQIWSLLKRKLNIAKLSLLTGTRKLIVDILFKLNGLLKRDFKEWKRSDYVVITKYLVTIFGAVGSSYKVETGYDVVDECSEYFKPSFEKEFNIDITKEFSFAKERLQECDTDSFNGAFVGDDNIYVK